MLRFALSALLLSLFACGHIVLPVSRNCDADAPPEAYSVIPAWNADPERLDWSLVEAGGNAWNRKCLRYERAPTEAQAILKVYPVQDICPMTPTRNGCIMAKTNIPTATVTVYMRCFMLCNDGFHTPREALAVVLTHEFGHAAGLPGHIHEKNDPKLAVNSFERTLMEHMVSGEAVMNPMVRFIPLTDLDERAYDLRIPSFSPFPRAAAAANASGPGDILDVAEAPDRCLLTYRPAP